MTDQTRHDFKPGDRVRIAQGSRMAFEGVIAGKPTLFGNYPVEIRQPSTTTVWLGAPSLTFIDPDTH